MPRFFLSPDRLSEADSQGGAVELDGENARHISLSLRMKVGDRLLLCDGKGNEYDAQITAMTAKTVTAALNGCQRSLCEPPLRIVLYQAVAKGDKMDSVIQKAVELGVAEIVPTETERCIAKIPRESVEKKVQRWQKIADEAAGQCGRGILPTIRPPMKFSEAVSRAASENAVALICYEGEGTRPFSALLPENPPKTLSFFIGPEGGFVFREVLLAEESGIIPVGLGRRILRTETASSFVLSVLSYVYEMPKSLNS